MLHTSELAEASSLYAKLLNWRPVRLRTHSGSFQAYERDGGVIA